MLYTTNNVIHDRIESYQHVNMNDNFVHEQKQIVSDMYYTCFGTSSF